MCAATIASEAAPAARRTAAAEAAAADRAAGALLVRPIGHVATPWAEKNGCPRQGTVAASRARLTLELDNAGDFVDGLAAYSHVHLLFHFHLNDARARARPKVRPPLLDGARVGVFSTRAPYRPNAIGLTVARLERVAGATLHLADVDLVHGTPIVDVKPYIPRYDAFPEARVPDWVREPPVRRVPVRISPLADAQLRSLFAADPDPAARSTLLDARGRRTRLEFFRSYDELRAAIEAQLSNDPRSVYNRAQHARGTPRPLQAPEFDPALLAHYDPSEYRGTYGICIDVLNMRCDFDTSTDPHTVEVLFIEDWRAINYKNV